MPTKTDPPLTLRGMTPMLVSVLLFSVNTLAIRAVAMHAPAADGWIASLFRGIVGLLVVFALHGRGRGLRMDRLFANRLVALRGVVGGLAIIIFYVTIVKLGAARAVILNLTYPVFASAIAALWLKEKLSRASVIWMLVGLCGLAIFLSGDGKLFHPSAYDLLALSGAASAGWVVVIIRKLRHQEHPATIFASQALYSLLIACPVVARLPQIPPVAWAGLTFAAIVVAIAQLEMTRAYQIMSVAKGSSIQMLLPIVTGIGGFLCFGETFQRMEILGATLTLLATWRVVARK
ncbi:MAG: DMT family transporter [Luteolibacter sp.]|jgi:drug/metabolite transporter (DMT)-like permease|nr:DMT family transporter [Luteolibacter sp.]